MIPTGLYSTTVLYDSNASIICAATGLNPKYYTGGGGTLCVGSLNHLVFVK